MLQFASASNVSDDTLLRNGTAGNPGRGALDCIRHRRRRRGVPTGCIDHRSRFVGHKVASLVAANTLTTIWARSAETVREIERAHTNSAYLPGESLHPQLRATTRMDDAVHSADVLVMAIPSSGFRAVLADAAPFVRPMIPVVSLTKGLELGTGSRMTQVVAEVLPGHPAGVLSGPNIAKKVVRGLAAAAVVAMPDQHIAQALQGIFRSRLFRVYTST